MAISNDATRRSALYSARGAVLRNINFDGSAPTAQRVLAVPEEVNLNQAHYGVSLLNDAKQGVVAIRIDNAPWQIRQVNFDGAVDFEHVTPAETATALRNAGFTGVTFTVDPDTGAACISAENPDTKIVQIFSLLAGALGFGGGRPFRSFGCFLYDGLTWKDVVALTTAGQKSEETTVSLANGYDGGTTDIVTYGGRTGDQVTWSVRNKDYMLLQMAEGGILVPFENGSIKYLPPARGDDVGERQIELWAMFPNYEDGVRQTQDEDTFATIKHYYKGTLVPQDDAEGGSTIATIGFIYNASAQYIDPDGGESVQPEIDKMSIPDWRQFILKDCVKPNPTALMVMVKPASAVTMGQSTINMVKNQVAYNALGTTPANAGGYTVSFSSPSVVTDLELSFDPDTKRVRIKANNATGSETVIVTVTNGDAASSEVTAMFTVVVS